MFRFQKILVEKRSGGIGMILLLLVLAAVALGGCAEPYEFHGTEVDVDTPAYDITGVDGDSQPFRLSDHRGEYVLVNFGYTFCPDVCPFTLADLAAFYNQLEEQDAALADDVSVVFVSVDPERDTPERLGPYIDAFHEDFYGIYIESLEELEVAKSAYGVFAEKNYPDGKETEDYLMDHSAGIYVIDPDGAFRLYFSYDTSPDEILADMEHLLRS